MDNEQLNTLTELLALYAEIESMKAANYEREVQGFAPAYGEEDFLHYAGRIRKEKTCRAEGSAGSADES